MVNRNLVAFIREARKRGFDDYRIRNPLLAKGWPLDEVEKAFVSLKPRVRFKNKVSLYLDSDVLKRLERRAKRNMFTITEQIEDILRRSVINHTVARSKEKLDDMLVTLFSRRKR